MHLIPSTDFKPEIEEANDFDTGNQRSPSTPNNAKSDTQESWAISSSKDKHELTSSPTPAPYITKCGRVVRPPKRLNL